MTTILLITVIIDTIVMLALLFRYIQKCKECIKLKEELEIIYKQVNEGTLKEWLSKTEDKAWEEL